MENRDTQAAGAPPAASERVELSYCPRCGTLRVHRPGDAADPCAACVRLLRWIYGEVRHAAADV